MTKISVKILPSVVTLGNLFCGFLAIAYIADGKLTAAAWLIFAGMIFDVLDGKVARLTKGSSDFGMELDSLADMISFGVAPAFLAKTYILEAPSVFPPRVAWTCCLVFVICAALRLARFNVETDHDESSHIYFKGLATPAASGVIASLVLSGELFTQILPLEYYKGILMVASFFLGALMVSRIRYLHLGIQLLKKRRPITDLLILVFFVSLVSIEPKVFILALTGGFLFYALLSPIREFFLLFLHPRQEPLPAIASPYSESTIQSNESEGLYGD